MSFNGNGLFEINTTGQPAVFDAIIGEGNHNALMADLAAGLSNAICKDGQTTVTQNIPFNGKKITGLGDGVALTDAATVGNIRAIGLAANGIVGLTSGQVLTAAEFGKALYYNAAPDISVTLPATDSAPIGSLMCFANLSTGKLTINRAGTSTIYAKGTTTASVVLNQGQTLVLVTHGGVNGNWAQFAGPAKRTLVKAANGYDWDEDDFIEQWGVDVRSTTAGVPYTITLPIAFPATMVGHLAVNGDTAANPNGIVGIDGGTTTTLICRNNVTGSFRTNWRAAGY